MGIWRDASGRLSFDLPGVAAADYPTVCRDVAESLGLVEECAIIIGPDQMFWEFRRGDQVVSLDWDTWMEFMAVAKSEMSEPLVRDIASRLRSSPWSAVSERAAPGAAADGGRDSGSS
jgi:hypothetical protein